MPEALKFASKPLQKSPQIPDIFTLKMLTLPLTQLCGLPLDEMHGRVAKLGKALLVSATERIEDEAENGNEELGQATTLSPGASCQESPAT